jgi:Cu(I)/Ag(I) efflux system membrane fusion protein
VWVLADLYEMDLSVVHRGDTAVFEADALPGERFEGRIEFVYPTVSGTSRTVKARLAFTNHGGRLRPGMFGRVRVDGKARASLVVPTDAVIRAGRHTYVFLARAGGRFEPRRVTPGGEDEGRIEILRGLAVGDTVVSGASFLIDSESRLEAAIEGMGSSAPGHAGNGSAP